MLECWNGKGIIIVKIPSPSACLNVCSRSFVIARDDAPDENKVFLIFEGAVCTYICTVKQNGDKGREVIKRKIKIFRAKPNKITERELVIWKHIDDLITVRK